MDNQFEGSSRFAQQPEPKSFRPAYIPPKKAKIVDEVPVEPKDKWDKAIQIFMLISAMVGFIVSIACLFATWLIDPNLSSNFTGIIGTFFQMIHAQYGTNAVLAFWSVCVCYFFIVAYRLGTDF